METCEDHGLAERILARECAYRGSFIQVDAVRVRLANGRETTHDVVRHPGAVAIVAMNQDRQVLMVRQYRTALERITLEIPAGKLDPDETPEACARRELAEETGYSAGELRYLTPLAVAAGYSNEIIHIFAASQLSAGQAHPDENEFIASQWLPLDNLINDILAGKITDSKTVAGLLMVAAGYHSDIASTSEAI